MFVCPARGKRVERRTRVVRLELDHLTDLHDDVRERLRRSPEVANAHLVAETRAEVRVKNRRFHLHVGLLPRIVRSERDQRGVEPDCRGLLGPLVDCHPLQLICDAVLLRRIPTHRLNGDIWMTGELRPEQLNVGHQPADSRIHVSPPCGHHRSRRTDRPA